MAVATIRQHLPEAKLRIVLPILERIPGNEIAIAIGDEIERRQAASAYRGSE